MKEHLNRVLLASMLEGLSNGDGKNIAAFLKENPRFVETAVSLIIKKFPDRILELITKLMLAMIDKPQINQLETIEINDESIEFNKLEKTYKQLVFFYTFYTNFKKERHIDTTFISIDDLLQFIQEKTALSIDLTIFLFELSYSFNATIKIEDVRDRVGKHVSMQLDNFNTDTDRFMGEKPTIQDIEVALTELQRHNQGQLQAIGIDIFA